MTVYLQLLIKIMNITLHETAQIVCASILGLFTGYCLQHIEMRARRHCGIAIAIFAANILIDLLLTEFVV